MITPSFRRNATDDHLRVISGFELTPAQRDAIMSFPVELLMEDAAARPSDAAAAVINADAWFGPGLTPSVFVNASNLRWLQTASVGVEYFLFPELIESSVVITSMRGRHAATSEHAMAMVLALARCLPDLIRRQSEHDWTKPSPDQVMHVDGTRMLIIGTGQIGRHIARRAAAFGIAVEGVSRSGAATEGFHVVHATSALLAAVPEADWVVDAAPLTSETTGMFSRDVFDAMKPGAVFINVGRGRTVDQGALVEALQSGRLRGAALDVFVDEPLPLNNPLWDLPNVIVTPHAAGVIPQAGVQELGVSCFLENLALFFDGQPLTGIDKSLGY